MPKVPVKSPSGASKYSFNKNNLEKTRKRDAKLQRRTERSAPKTMDKDIQRKAKELARSMGPINPLSLLSQISPFDDWMYFLAFLAALTKDILDLCIFLFGIGWLIPLLASFIIDPFIFFMMILGSVSGGRGRAEQSMVKSTTKQGLTILIGSVVDDYPGINILPIETFVVLVVYFMTLYDRVKNDRVEKAYQQMGV